MNNFRAVNRIVLIAALTFFYCLSGINFLRAQDKSDKGKVFYQLNYRPGDWITYTMTRVVNCMSFGNHQIFIGTTGGIIRYRYITKTYDYPLTVSNGLLDNDVRVIGFDQRSGYLYAATKFGLHAWDPYSQLMTAVRYGELGLGLDESILSIGFDVNTKIWIHTNRQFYSSYGSIRSIMPDNPENQIITWNGQLYMEQNPLPAIHVSVSDGLSYDAVQNTFTDQDFNRFPLTCYGWDATGLLWTGSQGAGVWRAETASNLMKPLPYGLYMKNASAIAFDNEFLWAGGSYARSAVQQNYTGLTEWDQYKDIFIYHASTYRKGIQFEETYSILADSAHVWIGTGTGLVQKSKKTDYWTTYGAYSGLYHTSVYALVFQQNKLFIGTKQGLNYAVPGKNNYDIYKVEIPELFNVSVFKMLSENSQLWLATNNGIYAIDEKQKKWFHYNAAGFKVSASALTRDEVRGIAENDSSIFFISNSNVVRLNKNSREWLGIAVNTEFLNAGVNDAKADNDNLWIAACAGVLRFNLSKQKWYFYSERDGLSDDYVYSILLDGDYIWFGTMEGLTQFFWNAPHLMD